MSASVATLGGSTDLTSEHPNTDLIPEALKHKTSSPPINAKPTKPKGVPTSIFCDTSRDQDSIPSDLSDFSLYGGLYRHVNLATSPHSLLKPSANKSIISFTPNGAPIATLAAIPKTPTRLSPKL